MRQVEQTKKERTSLEDEFKGATVDMQSKFLQALAAEGFLDNERIINTNLDELYGPLRTQVAEIVQNQQTLIEQIQVPTSSDFDFFFFFFFEMHRRNLDILTDLCSHH